MRVALLTASARPGNAIGNQVAEKVLFFSQRGDEVRVFAETASPVHPTVADYLTPLNFGATERDYLWSAELVIADYADWHAALGWLPDLVGRRARIILDYHSVTPAEFWSAAHRERVELGLQRRGIVWCADAALAHSSFATQELCAATRFPADRCHQLGYPIDLDRFRPARSRPNLRRRLGIGDARLLLFVGRLAPNKRVPILVEAVARFRDRSPAVHAVVVGDTSDIYAQEADRCRQRARELSVEDRLHFLGHVDDEILGDCYRSADVFVMPSVHEGFCLPVVEAMAAGTPVVAARAAALPETVGEGGLLFPPDDVLALTNQLRAVLEDPARAEGCRALGRIQAARHGRGCWREQFAAIVEALLTQPARPVRDRLALTPARSRRRAEAGTTILLPIQVSNHGSHAFWGEGLAPVVLRASVQANFEAGMEDTTVSQANAARVGRQMENPLPCLLIPTERSTAVVAVRVPEQPGDYLTRLEATRVGPDLLGTVLAEAFVELRVRLGRARLGEGMDRLASEAEAMSRLPDGYADVTEGVFASWKAWLKQKVLGNFRRMYVDVLSRRQTQFNLRIVTLLCDLLEARAGVRARLQSERRRRQELERRVGRLERLLARKGQTAGESP